MEGVEELHLFAEVGVALVGLIAIFLVLLERNGRFSAAESFHVRSLLASAAAVVAFALVPLVLRLYIGNDRDLWRVSGALSLAVGLAVSAAFALLQRSFPVGERWGLGFLFAAPLWILILFALILSAANAFGLAGGPSAAHHIATLAVIVLAALANFLTVALKRLL